MSEEVKHLAEGVNGEVAARGYGSVIREAA